MKLLLCLYLIFAAPQSIELIDQEGFGVSYTHQNLNSKDMLTITTDRTKGRFKLLFYKLDNKKLVNKGVYPFMSDVKTKVTFDKRLKGHFVLHVLNVETGEIIIVNEITL